MVSGMSLGYTSVGGTGEGNQPDDIRPGDNYSVGYQEQQHTYQGQALGPLYFPAHLVAGTGALIATAGSGQPIDVRWHDPTNVLETGPHDQTNPRPWP